MKKTKDLCCVICQVKDSYEYLPAFLARHSQIADCLYIIDHNSAKDLRSLTSGNVVVLRSQIGAYALDLGANSIIEHFRLRERFKWIFVLDVDEYLPFETRVQITDFDTRYSGYGKVEFQWQNSIPEHPVTNGIAGETSVLVSATKAPTIKLAYNTDVIGTFWVRHGNHFAFRPVPRFVDRYFPVKTTRAYEGLFHIPFLSFDHLKTKLRKFPSSNFFNKITKSATFLNKKYGNDWHQQNISIDDLLWLVTNYRSVGKAEIVDPENVRFIPRQLFSDVGPDVERWRQRIAACSDGNITEPTGRETDFIHSLRKRKYFFGNYLTDHIAITDDSTIRCTA